MELIAMLFAMLFIKNDGVVDSGMITQAGTLPIVIGALVGCIMGCAVVSLICNPNLFKCIWRKK